MSLTDLHKGTHNCAAAIRESGAGISPSTPPLPSRRLPLRPLSLQQPARSTPRRPPSTSSSPPTRGGRGWSPGTQSVRCYHFSTRVGGGVGGPRLGTTVLLLYFLSLTLPHSSMIYPSVALFPRRFSDTFERKGHLVGREYFSLISRRSFSGRFQGEISYPA